MAAHLQTGERARTVARVPQVHQVQQVHLRRPHTRESQVAARHPSFAKASGADRQPARLDQGMRLDNGHGDKDHLIEMQMQKGGTSWAIMETAHCDTASAPAGAGAPGSPAPCRGSAA